MECLHLLVTSGRENDILLSFRESWETLGYFRDVKVEGPRLQEDIAKYLDHTFISLVDG
jgi:hypothetical protein